MDRGDADLVQDPAWLDAMSAPRLFLHDGLSIMTGLGLVPSMDEDITSDDHDQDETVQERAKRLLTLEGSSVDTVVRLREFRSLAFKALSLWKSDLRKRRSKGAPKDSRVSLLDSWEQAVQTVQESNGAGFSAHLSFLLLLPLLESQSKTDPALCGQTAQILLQFLSAVKPMSLQHEPRECLDGLERLLTGWLQSSGKDKSSPISAPSSAGSLVALACGRGTLRSIFKVITTLLEGDPLSSLPIRSVVQSLQSIQTKNGPALLRSNGRFRSWMFDRDAIFPKELVEEDMATGYKYPKHPHELRLCSRLQNWNCDGGCGFRSSRATIEMPRYRCPRDGESCDYDICGVCMSSIIAQCRPSVATDGTYLYMSGRNGSGVVKLGSGVNGSLPGAILKANTKLSKGWLASGKLGLFHRPLKPSSPNVLCERLDSVTLEVTSTVLAPGLETKDTLAFLGDGVRLYHVWLIVQDGSMNHVGVDVYEIPEYVEQEEQEVEVDVPKDRFKGTYARSGEEGVFFNQSVGDIHPGDLVVAINQIAVYNMVHWADAAKTVEGCPTADVCFKGRSVNATLVCSTVLKAKDTIDISPPKTASSNGVLAKISIRKPSTDSAKQMTSAGLKTSIMRSATYYTCGKSISFIVSPVGSNGLSFSAGHNHSNTTFDQHSFSITTGLPTAASPSLQLTNITKGALAQTKIHDLAVVSDPVNNVFWICTDRWVEQWVNQGYPLKSSLRVPESKISDAETPTGVDISPTEAFTRLLAFASSQCQSMGVVRHSGGNLDVGFWKEMATVLIWASKENQEGPIISVLEIFKTVLRSQSVDPKELSAEDLNKVRDCIWLYIEHENMELSTVAADCICAAMSLFYPHASAQREVFMKVMRNEKLKHVTKALVKELGGSNALEGSPLHPRKNSMEFFKFFSALLDLSRGEIKESLAQLEANGDAVSDTVFLATDTVQCLAAWQSTLLSEENPDSNHLEKLTGLVLDASIQSLEEITNAFKNIEKTPSRKQHIIEIVKSSACGYLIPALIANVHLETPKDLPKSTTSIIRQLNQIIQLFGTLELLSLSEDDEIQDDDAPGLKTWTQGQVIESIHPVRDNYKFLKTVSLSGTQNLFLTFDSRSSSQYDYDKVCVYAGPTNKSRKVAEFGGNTAGFGSRSVLGGGWPKEPLKIPGDTVTVEFEMKSGRESSTPDHAMWGFRIAVRGLCKIPLLLDLELSATDWLFRLTELQYLGPPISEAEKKCKALLQANPDFLLDCGWAQVLPRLPQQFNPRQLQEWLEAISTSVSQPAEMNLLRSFANCPLLIYRPSIKTVVQPETLEYVILAAVMAHFGLDLETIISLIDEDEEIPDWLSGVISNVFTRIRSIERHLIAIAEMEQSWTCAISDIRSGTLEIADAFFAGWHLLDEKEKDLRLLCQCVGKQHTADASSVVKTLLKALEDEVADSASNVKGLTRTEGFVNAMIERAHVSRMLYKSGDEALQRTFSIDPQAPQSGRVHLSTRGLADDSFDVGASPRVAMMYHPDNLARTFSAPPVLEVLSGASLVQDLSERQKEDGVDIRAVVSGVFGIITTGVFKVNMLATGTDLLATCGAQKLRASGRLEALRTIHSVLKTRLASKGIMSPAVLKFLVESVTGLLNEGMRQNDIICSGDTAIVQQAYAEAMRDIMLLVNNQPILCQKGLALCAVPFTRREAVCIVQSGVLNLLGSLCSKNVTDIHVADMAWAAFQLIALRCADWDHGATETERNDASCAELGLLPKQIASLLSARLAQSVEDLNTGEMNSKAAASATELLQLLDDLAGSHLGQSVVSEPKCLGSLLRLTCSDNTTPRMLQAVVRLLAVALPLMPDSDKELANLLQSLIPDIRHGSQHELVVSVLLEKLSKFISPIGTSFGRGNDSTPGRPPVLSKDALRSPLPPSPITTSTPISSPNGSEDSRFRTPPQRAMVLPYSPHTNNRSVQNFHECPLQLNAKPYDDHDHWQCDRCNVVGDGPVYHCSSCNYDLCIQCQEGGNSGKTPKSETVRGLHKRNPSGPYLVRLHRRENQSPRDVIHPLLRMHRRFGGSDYEPIESVMRVDRELAEGRNAVAHRGTFASCLERATEWAQAGLVVNIEPDADQSHGKNGQEDRDNEFKHCRQMNSTFVTNANNRRRFIDGAVAESIANSLIGLLQSLVATDKELKWRVAITEILSQALTPVPLICETLSCANGPPPSAVISDANKAVVALCLLGGFRESVSVGSHVLVAYPGFKTTIGKVIDYNMEEGKATVSFGRNETPVPVPARYLQSAYDDPPKPIVTLLKKEVVACLSALLSQGQNEPVGIQSNAKISSDDEETVAVAHRLLAEMRTRACMVFALRIRCNPKEAVEGVPADTLKIVTNLAKEAQQVASTRLAIADSECASLRRVIFERSRPSMDTAPNSGSKPVISARLDPVRVSPPLKGVIMSRDYTSARLMVQRNLGSSNTPFYGAVIYANQPVNTSEKRFYFEVRIVTLLGAGTDLRSHPLHQHLVGLVDKDTAWACDAHSAHPRLGGCGRKDVAGSAKVGRYRCSEGCDFDLCEDCIKKGNGRNLMSVGFAPAPSSSSSEGKWSWPESSALFSADGTVSHLVAPHKVELPTDFTISNGDVIGCIWSIEAGTIEFVHNGNLVGIELGGIRPQSNMYPVIHLRTPGSEIVANFGSSPFEYSVDELLGTLEEPEEDITKTGLFGMMLGGSEEDEPSSETETQQAKPTYIDVSDVTKVDSVQPNHYVSVEAGNNMLGSTVVHVGEDEEEEEDPTARLIKAWETQVFPKIRNRFRSSGDRKSGLEQIKGALMFGMPEVARQTVEGLYEENGGIPSDLHLPTIEDLKATAGKLGAREMRPGMRVKINVADHTSFEVAGMERTRGLTGTIKKVDVAKAIALVATYVADEGTIACWWYPCSILQKADHPVARIDGPGHYAEQHKELLVCESKVTRLYCRAAILHMVEVPDVLAGLSESITKTEGLKMLSYEQHILPRIGRCHVRDVSSRVFFDWSDGSDVVLLDQLSAAVQSSIQANQLEQFVKELCQCLYEPNFQVALAPVNTGRGSFDISFENACATLISVRAKDPGSNVISRPPGHKEHDQWARIYLADPKTSPRMGFYPCTSGGPSPLPCFLLPSPKAYIRTSAQDITPNAIVTAHSIPNDFPLTVAFIERIVTEMDDFPATVENDLICALAKLLRPIDIPPVIRCVLIQSLAALIRKAKKLTKETMFVVEMASEWKKELLEAYKKAQDANENISTYFQSLMEVVLAVWEVNGPIPLPKPEPKPEESSASEPKSPRPREAAASPARKGPSKRRTLRASPRKKKSANSSSANSKAPAAATLSKEEKWFSGIQAMDALLRVFLRKSTAGRKYYEDAFTSLVDDAWASVSEPHFLKRMAVLSNLSTTKSVTQLQNDLKTVARRAGGSVTDILIQAKEDGSPTGRAVLELRAQVQVERFKNNLSSHPDYENVHFHPFQLSKKPAFTASSPNTAAVASPFGAPFPPLTTEEDNEGEHTGFSLGSLQLPAFGSPEEPKSEEDISAITGVIDDYLRTIMVTQDEVNAELQYALLHVICPAQSSKEQRNFDDLAASCNGVSLEDVLQCSPFMLTSLRGTPAQMVRVFMSKIGCDTPEAITQVFEKFGKSAAGSEGLRIFPEGFLALAHQHCSTSPRDIADMLLQLGFDLHFTRYKHTTKEDAVEAMSKENFTVAMDRQLVQHINQFSRACHLPAESIFPDDYVIKEVELAHVDLKELQQTSPATYRLRFAMIRAFNSYVVDALKSADLRVAHIRDSFSALLSEGRFLMFYDLKNKWLGDVVNDTAQRIDANGPEINLDPLETVNESHRTKGKVAQFVQAAEQFDSIDPALVRVRIAAGGDPTFPLNVRLSGEVVQGTSGSFRDFLNRMADDLRDGRVNLAMECPSAALGRNKGSMILRPDAPSFSTIRLLEFFGVLIGVTIRSDVPLPLDFLPSFWKSLVSHPLDAHDIEAADYLTFSRLHRMEKCSSEADFLKLVEEPLTFTVQTLGGSKVSLPGPPGCEDQADIPVTWSNRTHYIKQLRELRLRELNCKVQMDAIRRGLSQIVPTSFLSVMTWQDVQIRVSGIPDIDLTFLKAHTMYQVGLTESDPHVVFFWNTLENFSKEELRMFVKFACNQERIPASCPCQDGSNKSHVPPYPMKIAPPDGQGFPDSRYIRAETCLFMVKLPQYSTQELMSERLSYAIRCRDDPLSG